MPLTAEQSADLEHQKGNRVRVAADRAKATTQAERDKLDGWLKAIDARIAELEALAAKPAPAPTPTPAPVDPAAEDKARRAAALEAAHKRQAEAMRAVVEALTLLEGLQAKAAEFLALVPPFVTAAKAAASGLADAAAGTAAAGYSPEAAGRTADAIRAALDPVLAKLPA